MTVRLLIPFDASPAALRAVELAAGHAGEPDALAVRLLNVQTRPVSLWPGAGLDPAAIEAALMDAGRKVLEPALSRFGAAGISAAPEVRLGHPAEGILHEAAKCDVVVMGTRGTGALQGFALGSVALRVAHGGRAAPVILVKPEDRLPAALGKRLRVLLAMDGSPAALRAAERLAAWRGWLGEMEVHLAYVQQPLTYLQTVMPPHDDVIGQWSTQEGREATQAARELFKRAGIAQHLHLTIGDPALEIPTLAAQTSSELVALGTRGLGAAHHALIGSVALKAAVRCEVPVMLA